MGYRNRPTPRIDKAVRLIAFLQKSQPLPAKMISAAVELDHAATLQWLYVLRDHGLVENGPNERPIKWRWKQ